MSQLIDDLKATKAELVAHGRCTGDLIDERSRVCLLGAIGIATIPNFEQKVHASGGYGLLESDERALAVINTLKGHLAPLPHIDDSLERVWNFNDDQRVQDGDGTVFDLIEKALADLGGLG